MLGTGSYGPDIYAYSYRLGYDHHIVAVNQYDGEQNMMVDPQMLQNAFEQAGLRPV